MALPLLPLAPIALVLLPLTPAYDLDVFLRAGQAVLHGQPVYPPVGSSEVYSGSAFVYPYLVVSPFVVLALLPSGVATVVFFAAGAGAVLAACLLMAEREPWPAVFVMSSAFAVTGLQLGAVSPMLFAGAIFMWKLRDRPALFGLVAGPVVACKLFLLPLLAWPLFARRWHAFAYAGASTLMLLLAGFVVGPFGPVAYVHMLSRLGAHEARAGFGLAGALMNIGVAPATAEATAIATAAAVLAVAAVRELRVRDERVLFSAAIVASLLASPVVWSHYFLLLAAPLLVFRVSRRWLLIAGLASWAVAPPHGQHVDTDAIEGVASSGTWLVVLGAALIVLRCSSLTRVTRRKGYPTSWSGPDSAR
jgi:hypothetical protein